MSYKAAYNVEKLFKVLSKLSNEATDIVKDMVDPLVGRKIICFSTHGCQAQIHEFMWVGVIVGTRIQPSDYESNRFKQYCVKTLKNNKGELRNSDDPEAMMEYVHPSEIQNLGDEIMIVYK